MRFDIKGKIISNLCLRIVLISSLVVGIIAHGSALFNKYAMHDEITTTIGLAYSAGRWLLGIFCAIDLRICGGYRYSTPVINVLLSILFISLSSYLVISLLEIKNKVFWVLISGLMVAFPMVAIGFGYMFMSQYYALSLLFAVAGTYFICKYNKWYTWTSGIVLSCWSLGIYQAYLPVILGLMVLHLMLKIVKDETKTVKNFLTRVAYLVLSSIAVMVLYVVVTFIFLRIYNIELVDYRGISSVGKGGIITYLARVKDAYLYFISPKPLQYDTNSMFPMSSIYLYKVSMLFTAILLVFGLINKCKKNIIKYIEIVLLVLVLPLAINFIFIMCEPDLVTQLMVYGQVLFFVSFIWAVEQLMTGEKKYHKIVLNLSYVLVFLLLIIYCKYDNVVYLKTEFTQERLKSYYTTLITRIKSTDGYKDEYPVVYINENNIKDLSAVEIEDFSSIRLAYLESYEGGINNYAWRDFVDKWCGYKPIVGNVEEFKDMPEVRDMPSYPDSGSIKVIDKTVVIKF